MKTRDRQLAVLAACDEANARLKRQHTPGPWKVMPDPSYEPGLHPLHHHRFIATEAMGVDDRDGVKDFDGKGSLICALRDQENQAADAHLIAAAPDLLAALRDITACVHMTGPHGTTAYLISDERMNAAREAIEKAEAGQ